MTKKPETKNARPHAIIFTKPSLTKKSLQNETNINAIMARYETTGIIDHIANKNPSYGDFSNLDSYQESLNKITQAQEQFQSYPAALRKMFDNDASKFLEFCSNPENLPQMREMGLAEPLPETPASPSESSENVSQTPTGDETP